MQDCAYTKIVFIYMVKKKHNNLHRIKYIKSSTVQSHGHPITW